MGNWDHLLNHNRFSDGALPIMQRFHERLQKLSIDIEKRNEKRRFPMQSFNPTHMESSVSV
jgi:hypothetical protein